MIRVRMPTYIIKHQADCERIQQVLLDSEYVIDLDVAQSAWESYSEDMAAGWLALPEDDQDLFDAVMSVVEVVDE